MRPAWWREYPEPLGNPGLPRGPPAQPTIVEMFRCLFAAALASHGRVLVIEPHVVSGEVPVSRAACIELTKREAWEAKLGRLSSDWTCCFYVRVVRVVFVIT